MGTHCVWYELREDGKYRIEGRLGKPDGRIISTKEEKIDTHRIFLETLAYILRD